MLQLLLTCSICFRGSEDLISGNGLKTGFICVLGQHQWIKRDNITNKFLNIMMNYETKM